jgi:hypothetical protein
MAQRLTALFRGTEKMLHMSLLNYHSQNKYLRVFQSLRTLIEVSNKDANNGLIENKFLQSLIPHFNKPSTNPKPGAMSFHYTYICVD